MKFSQNLPGWQRVLRVAFGACIACAGIFFVKMPILICVLILACLVAVSGLVGFCPACCSRKDGKY
jgi:hypothetical protein